MKLVIGNKNYSSWSLRVWLAMAEADIAFEEVLIVLDQPDTKARIAEYSPSGRVPTLVDGDVVVWETLAILEYLAERFPDKQLWPAERKARTMARAIASEMHSGFMALRAAAPMNLWRPIEAFPREPEVEADVRRITTLWREARSRYGAGGPFLFGRFSNADAMYAPIATRLRTYAIPVDEVSAAYVETIHAMASFKRWRDAGLKETWLIAGDERDWPTVKRV